jgi:hypothetical protein
MSSIIKTAIICCTVIAVAEIVDRHLSAKNNKPAAAQEQA